MVENWSVYNGSRNGRLSSCSLATNIGVSFDSVASSGMQTSYVLSEGSRRLRKGCLGDTQYVSSFA